MMAKAILLFFLLLSSGLYPQDSAVNWYKGNLHTHTLWSDGDAFPEMAVDWYKQNKYDFIALSDHNVLHAAEKWVMMKEEDDVYQRYINVVDSSRIEKKKIGEEFFVKLKTFNEYRPLFEEKGKFLIIQSEEISDKFMGKPVHINASNISELIEPQGGSTILEVMQNNINAVNLQRTQTGIPMFPHVNHPNFRWALTAEDIINLEGDRFFEVYNGHPLVNNYGDSLHLSTEDMWDKILTERLRAGKDIMYGLAVDDAHNYLDSGLNQSNPGRGWVMVRADSLSAASLITALEKGDFYSSTGVTLDTLKITNEGFKIAVAPEEDIDYRIMFIGNLKDSTTGKGPVLFQENISTSAEYYFKGHELYVRAVIISSKLKENPYKEREFEKAWIQPVMVE